MKKTFKNILVVEDFIADQVSVLVEIEKVFGYHVTVDIVSDAFSAITLLKQNFYSLLILDYDLSLGNGEDVLKFLATEGEYPRVAANSIIPENNRKMVDNFPNIIDTVTEKRYDTLYAWLTKLKGEK